MAARRRLGAIPPSLFFLLFDTLAPLRLCVRPSTLYPCLSFVLFPRSFETPLECFLPPSAFRPPPSLPLTRSRRQSDTNRPRRGADAESGRGTAAASRRCCGTGATACGGTKTTVPGRKGCSCGPSLTTPVPSRMNTSCSWPWACWRRVSARGNLELPHGETGGVVVGADQAADAAAGGPFHLDGRGLDLFVMDDFHTSPPSSFIGTRRCIAPRIDSRLRPESFYHIRTDEAIPLGVHRGNLTVASPEVIVPMKFSDLRLFVKRPPQRSARPASAATSSTNCWPRWRKLQN